MQDRDVIGAAGLDWRPMSTARKDGRFVFLDVPGIGLCVGRNALDEPTPVGDYMKWPVDEWRSVNDDAPLSPARWAPIRSLRSPA